MFVCLNMAKHKHKDGLSLFKFPTDKKLKDGNGQDKLKELDLNVAVLVNICVCSGHLCVCRTHFSQHCVQEISSVSKNVGMKMKQLLKPEGVPTIFPKAIRNCSPPLVKRRHTAFKKERRFSSELFLLLLYCLLK